MRCSKVPCNSGRPCGGGVSQELERQTAATTHLPTQAATVAKVSGVVLTCAFARSAQKWSMAWQGVWRGSAGGGNRAQGRAAIVDPAGAESWLGLPLPCKDDNGCHHPASGNWCSSLYIHFKTEQPQQRYFTMHSHNSCLPVLFLFLFFGVASSREGEKSRPHWPCREGHFHAQGG